MKRGNNEYLRSPAAPTALLGLIKLRSAVKGLHFKPEKAPLRESPGRTPKRGKVKNHYTVVTCWREVAARSTTLTPPTVKSFRSTATIWLNCDLLR